jgi:hypothetical protein
MEEIGQSGIAAELGDEPRDVVAAQPTACWALNAQDIEAADQTADRAIKRHGAKFRPG